MIDTCWRGPIFRLHGGPAQRPQLLTRKSSWGRAGVGPGAAQRSRVGVKLARENSVGDGQGLDPARRQRGRVGVELSCWGRWVGWWGCGVWVGWLGGGDGVEADGEAQGVGLADDVSHGALGVAVGEVVSA